MLKGHRGQAKVTSVVEGASTFFDLLDTFTSIFLNVDLGAALMYMNRLGQKRQIQDTGNTLIIQIMLE